MDKEIYASFILQEEGRAICGRCLESVTLDKKHCAPYDTHYCPHCGAHFNEHIKLPTFKNVDIIAAEYTDKFKKFKKENFRGKWIRQKYSKMAVYNPVWDLYTVKYRCSVCDRISLLHEGYQYDFCPWCGTKMEAENEEP